MRYRPICAIDRSRCAIGGSLVSAAIDRSRNDRSIAQQSTDRCALRRSTYLLVIYYFICFTCCFKSFISLQPVGRNYLTGARESWIVYSTSGDNLYNRLSLSRSPPAIERASVDRATIGRLLRNRPIVARSIDCCANKRSTCWPSGR